MRGCVVLSYRDTAVGVLDDCAAVVIYVEIIGGREDGDDGREAFGRRLLVHGISGKC